MKSVTVKKKDLIKALKKNRAIHEKEYEEAIGGYRLEAEQKVSELLDKIKSGVDFQVQLYLNEPESHLEDYDSVIGMLEVANEKTLEITTEEYRKYYQNKWDWHQSWKVANDGYATLYNVSGMGNAKP